MIISKRWFAREEGVSREANHLANVLLGVLLPEGLVLVIKATEGEEAARHQVAAVRPQHHPGVAPAY